MNQLFNLGLVLLIAYLVATSSLSSVEGEKLILQLIAGMGALVMLSYSFLCGLKALRITKTWSFSRLWIIFTALIGLYFVLAQIELPSPYAWKNARNFIIAIYIVVATLFIYYGVVYRHLSEHKIIFLTGMLMVGALFELYNAMANPLEKLGVEVINTSSGYVFAMLLPIMMYRYRAQGFWVFVLLLGLTAMSGKRGALVIFAVLAVYYVFNHRNLGLIVKFNWKTVVAASFAVIALVYFVETAYESVLFRFQTIVHPERGTIGSGRDIIWGGLIEYWRSASVGHIFLGSGYYSTIAIQGFVAHNDFIQFLVDYGLFGLLIYVVMLCMLYQNIRSMRPLDRYIYCLLFMCVIILVGRGLFAGTLRSDQIYWSVSIGYLLGVATLKRLEHGFKS